MDYEDMFSLMFDDPEYRERMDEMQRHDHKVMGELWVEENGLPREEDLA